MTGVEYDTAGLEYDIDRLGDESGNSRADLSPLFSAPWLCSGTATTESQQ